MTERTNTPQIADDPSSQAIRYPVLLEAVEGGWIASILGIAAYRAVGASRDEAVRGLEKVMQQRLCELLPFEVTHIELSFAQLGDSLLSWEQQTHSDIKSVLVSKGQVSKISFKTSVETSAEPNPLLKFAGHLKDDPFFDEYMESIAEQRRELDDEFMDSEDLAQPEPVETVAEVSL